MKNLCLVPDRDYPSSPDPDLLIFRTWKPLSAIIRAAHSAMGRNSSQAVTESTPSTHAIIESRPVPTQRYTKKFRCRYQCCGSGSVPYPNWIRIQWSPWIRTGSQSGSGSRGKNNPQTRQKKIYKFHFLKCWMFSIEGEGFSCSLDIGKLQFLIKKKIIFSCNLQILVIETLDPDSLKMLDPDP